MGRLNREFWSALKSYAESGQIPLHMPGHKNGRGFRDPELAAIGSIDFTELPGLDDWHRPDGPLLNTQKELAALYGAQKSYLLTNGATSGIHALLLALGENARVVMPRQIHRSFFGGMVLAGTIPLYIPAQLDERWGLPLLTSVKDARALLAEAGAAALFSVSPSYFGTCGQEAELIQLAHQQRIPAFFDAAHGAHFGFHPGYPPGIMQLGADAAVHGLHKTLPALTGVGCLHLQGSHDWQLGVEQALDLLISTSPSQPLLASGEWAITWLDSPEGRNGLEQMYQNSVKFSSQLREVKGLVRIQGEEKEPTCDPGRVSIGLEGLSINGYQMEALLQQEFGIRLEMAGANYIVAIFTPFNTEAEWDALLAALQKLTLRYYSGGNKLVETIIPPIVPVQLSPRQAFLAPKKRRVKISQAHNLISGELVAAYPPGIPCLVPGEIITAEMADYLEYLRLRGGRLQGLLDPEVQYIYVIDM